MPLIYIIIIIINDSLFSEDINENFIILSTFANKDTITDRPTFIEYIQREADFLNFKKKRIEDKWWFAFDSKCVLDNEEDKLTLYSFSQLSKLYEEKVKKMRPKKIKKYDEVLEARYQLKIKINLLNDTFQNLLMEQGNLQEKEKNINEISNKIEDLLVKIDIFGLESKNLSSEELRQKLEELNKEINNKIKNFNIGAIVEYVNLCEYNNINTYTHCDSCERNCHDICNCIGNNLDRCIRFYLGIYGDERCDECGCLKEKHKVDHYHWVRKSINKKNDTIQQIKEKENQKYIIKTYSIKRYINELKNNINILKEEKNKKVKEQNEIKKKIENTSNKITYIIIQLKNISQKIEEITLNRSHLNTLEEYIDSLKDKMEQIGLEDEKQKESLKRMKENIKIFKEVNQLKEDEMMNLTDSQLAERLGIIIPNSKNSY